MDKAKAGEASRGSCKGKTREGGVSHEKERGGKRGNLERIRDIGRDDVGSKLTRPEGLLWRETRGQLTALKRWEKDNIEEKIEGDPFKS